MTLDLWREPVSSSRDWVGDAHSRISTKPSASSTGRETPR
jgi:hypothetical protein